MVDRTPVVTIESPAGVTLVEPHDVVTLRFFASDDAGIASVDMHMRMPSGEERERRLWSALDDGGPRAELRASSSFGVDELGAREGDAIVVWLEAHDGDMVGGPNTGKSAEITLELASPDKRLASFIPALQAAADAAVALLGNRLERPLTDDPVQARARFSQLERETHDWLGLLDEVVKRAQGADDARALDLDQVRGIRKRNQRLLDQETGLHAEPVRPLALRSGHDERSIAELERDVIMLADLLAKAHVDEAGAIADELRELKKHIEELLSKLGKDPSPEDERKLMAEIARAERRLAELSQSLSRMATRVPSEFVNREALEAPEAQSTLEDLEKAVRGHDLRSAAEHLEKLAKQIDEMASQIGEGGMKLRESRFGPQDQAMAGARRKLDMLSAEQERLAGRSQELMKGMQERAGGQSGDERARELSPQAEALRQSLDELSQPGSPQDFRSQQIGRAQERLGDARDALENGDLAAANGMAQAAAQDLEQAAQELESEARMFPGHQGETARKAEAARKAADDAKRLTQEIAKGTPSASGEMTAAERKRMQDDLEPQRKTRDATSQLRDEMESGPNGMPLSPDGVESLDQAREAMQRAEQAMQRGDVKQASQQQADASSKLKKLAQKLAEEQRQGGSGAPGHEQEGDSGSNAENTPVHIPGADEFKGPAQMRRKLLDAMREATPSGFEAAVQRYYQELLR
jgi:hypothetical protein